MVLDVDQNDNGMIEFNEFLQMMSKKMREGDSEDELKEAFKWVYDFGPTSLDSSISLFTGEIYLNVMLHALTSISPRLC